MTIKPTIWGGLHKAFATLTLTLSLCVGSLPGQAHASRDSTPRFIYLGGIGTGWALLKLPGDEKIMVVSWDEANKNAMCLATVGEGPDTGYECLRPHQSTTADNAINQIAQIGQRNNKNQLIGTLTCDSPKYIAAFGPVARNNPRHWCNIARARLENSNIVQESGIAPFTIVNGLFWYILYMKGETLPMLVAWDKANKNPMCLATAEEGNPTNYSCRRPKNTLAPEDLDKLVKLMGKRDSDNNFVGTLTCDSPSYIALYGNVDTNNKEHWCVYAKSSIGPNAPKLFANLFAKDKQKANQNFQKLEQSGQYPVLDRGSSLAGPDTNHNGVRDDIEAWINKNWRDPQENKAVVQLARVYQMQVTSDRSDVRRIRTVENVIIDRSVECMNFTFPDLIWQNKVLDEIKGFTLNTKERKDAFYVYQGELGGIPYSPPDKLDGSFCDQYVGNSSRSDGSGSSDASWNRDAVSAPTCPYGSYITAFADVACNPKPQYRVPLPRRSGVDAGGLGRGQ